MDPLFRSSPSRRECRLGFINRTLRTVNIHWVNYSGEEINYGSLEPGHRKIVHSFEGHPWVCRDVFTKRKYFLNGNEVIIPRSKPEDLAKDNHSLSLIVNISFHVISMAEMCADLIAQHLSSLEDIQTLQIPTITKNLITESYETLHMSVKSVSEV
ncbi:hypothetical protein CEXT_153551 [Caerostris extrusa]|uniref:von Hippel-Lindau disease tumour suppressor beta domain-containing protein n=1 Tax=Caerostris extrusa TaxID=172846 RepID=A0AAV4RVB0_CAEEX|nr:hypothetical protein CEXT_153551 [Caerostris extrusa]